MFSPDFFASTKFTVLFLYKKMTQSLFHKILVRISCRRKKVLSFELSNSQFGALEVPVHADPKKGNTRKRHHQAQTSSTVNILQRPTLYHIFVLLIIYKYRRPFPRTYVDLDPIISIFRQAADGDCAHEENKMILFCVCRLCVVYSILLLKDFRYCNVLFFNLMHIKGFQVP